jgi:hypothetical protein
MLKSTVPLEGDPDTKILPAALVAPVDVLNVPKALMMAPLTPNVVPLSTIVSIVDEVLPAPFFVNTLNEADAPAAIEVNVTPQQMEGAVVAEPGGTAQLPSARRKLLVPPPLAGANPLAPLVTASSSAVACVPVSAVGAAEPPELLPMRVLLLTAGGV